MVLSAPFDFAIFAVRPAIQERVQRVFQCSCIFQLSFVVLSGNLPRLKLFFEFAIFMFFQLKTLCELFFWLVG